MIRHSKPKRIIEVGSGYSSAMTLDTNELHFGNSIRCTFIEPYPELLQSLLRPGDRERIEVLPVRVQEVPLERFAELESGDILFIDSTHVAKAGSDVPYLYFQVLPRLKPGVLVHIHDIFSGFEYPQPWVFEGRNWNEIYILRAFLMFNRAFRVLLFNTFLEQSHRDWFAAEMPLCLRNEGGNIWLRREDG
jgi:predicted O-methyltransferase YrrM